MKIQLRKNYNQVMVPLLLSRFNISTDSYIEQDLTASSSVSYQSLNSIVLISYGLLVVTADSNVFNINNYLIIDTPIDSLQIQNQGSSDVSFVLFSDIVL